MVFIHYLQLNSETTIPKNQEMIAKVALGIPYSLPFDYIIPGEIKSLIEIGRRVLVSVGNRVMIGVVVDLVSESSFDSLKEVFTGIDEEALFSAGALRLTKWIADYYLVSWGEVLEASLPGGLKPAIEKSVTINLELSKNLSVSERAWLAAIDGQNEKKVKLSSGFKEHKSRYSIWKRQGVIRHDYKAGDVGGPDIFDDVLSINTSVADQITTREGSKPDRVIKILREKSPVSISALQSEIPGVNQPIRQLIEKKAVFKEKIRIKPEIQTKPINSAIFYSLNEEQEIAFYSIHQALVESIFRTFLLFGVTGSGKTEIYLHLVRETLSKKRTVLILIPEISLTHQVVNRFKSRFGGRIAVLHSGMAEKERRAEWWKIKKGICDIAIGARSAIFSPLENIGLIVVDEEHDTSYKQQESPFYNARDVAVKLGQDHDAVVVLGSATPSVESFNNVFQNKYELLRLTNRANQKPLPPITVVNLKEEKRQSGVFYLSRFLVNELKENLSAGKQALVFLNRRGYAAFLSCQGCDLPVLCANCSIALTWHRTEKRLICHHCGYRRPYPERCPSCGEKALRLDGIGTERVERDLKLIFPSARFLRMDRDTVRRKGVLEKNIDKINHHEVDFIIGTQLISKGHDFKQVGLVCVVLADIGLNIPDFRSSERSFQLISQVSGRAGRDELGVGQVLAQTYNPEHFAITAAVKNDVEGFVRQELALRKDLDNPPSVKMILIKISGEKPGNVEHTAKQLGSLLVSKAEDLRFVVLGPVEAPILRINKRYNWQILVKSKNINDLKSYLRFLFWEQKEWKPSGATRISIDVDPYYLM